jgi:peptide/nickel transport system substrate-binding protein
VIKTRRSGRLIAAAAAMSLVIAACGGDDDTASDEPAAAEAPADEPADAPAEEPADEPAAAEEPAEEPSSAEGAGTGVDGGTLIWAHEQEPPDLHLDDPENNLSITSWIRSALIEGFYGISGGNDYYPELLDGEAVPTTNDDGSVTITYTLRSGAMWSDGTPLTAADAKFTFDAVMAKDDAGEYIYLAGDRSSLEQITAVEVVSDTEITMTWAGFNAGWKDVNSEIYPAHIFSDDPATAAAELNEALREWSHNGATLPSSGPMLFDSWERGVQFNMVRNDMYHGSNSPDSVNKGVAYVDGVQINFVTDTDAQINALLAGEAQIVMTQPQLAFEQLSSSDDFTVKSSAGPVFEHWGLNLNAKHVNRPEVREALALAMDKSEVMAGLYTPLFGESLPAEGLGNVFWLSNQAPYENHAGDAGYGAGDIDSAKAALESAGYVMGSDGIYEHPEDGRLTLRVGTTGGNRLREIQQELLQAKFAEAGIEIVIENVQGAAYFDIPFGEDHLACAMSGGTEGNCDTWEITQFAWVGGPWPGSMGQVLRSGGGNNTYGFMNDEFDALIDTCDGTVDDDERAACYNTMDKYATTLEMDPENGLFMMPITQKPSFYGYTSDLVSAGVAPDAQGAGPLANVVDFQFAG